MESNFLVPHGKKEFPKFLKHLKKFFSRKAGDIMTRMRTIQQTIDYLKAQDADTAVTEYWLRGLLASGVIPYHKAGKKFLVNLDALEQYLAKPPEEPVIESGEGKIRQINVGRR